MDANALISSQYLKAADLQNKSVKVVMSHVDPVIDPKIKKPILYFIGKQKGMALNKINLKKIISLYGSETDAWSGKPIEIYPTETEFEGDRVPCIRIRAATSAPLPAPPPVMENEDPNVPF